MVRKVSTSAFTVNFKQIQRFTRILCIFAWPAIDANQPSNWMGIVRRAAVSNNVKKMNFVKFRNMKNRKVKILTLSLFLILTLLYILVLFAFYFQQILSTDLQYLFPISIFILFHLFALLAILSIKELNISSGKKIISIITFIIINTALLYSLSSIKRESQIQGYFSKHEQKINEIIDYYIMNGEDNEFSSMLKEMNIRSFYYTNDEYHIGLYSFAGYGYRVLYTKKANIKPLSPGGSPTEKWFKINENWYYYSYWD